MAGHMDEVVSLIDKARHGAAQYCYLLSAALVPEPVAQMLHMYITTYRPEGRAVSVQRMQERMTTGVEMLFGIPCIPVPNLADVSVVVDGRILTAESFIYHCEAMRHKARLIDTAINAALPPGALTLEHNDGDNT